MNSYYVIAPSNNDLQHHGRLGQKWGKKNGPPYPLSKSQMSSAEKKKGGLISNNKDKMKAPKEAISDLKNIDGKKWAAIVGVSTLATAGSIGSAFLASYLGVPAAGIGGAMGFQRAGMVYLTKKGYIQPAKSRNTIDDAAERGLKKYEETHRKK